MISDIQRLKTLFLPLGLGKEKCFAWLLQLFELYNTTETSFAPALKGGRFLFYITKLCMKITGELDDFPASVMGNTFPPIRVGE